MAKKHRSKKQGDNCPPKPPRQDYDQYYTDSDDLITPDSYEKPEVIVSQESTETPTRACPGLAKIPEDLKNSPTTEWAPWFWSFFGY